MCVWQRRCARTLEGGDVPRRGVTPGLAVRGATPTHPCDDHRSAIVSAMTQIARLAWTAIDCPGPRELAGFYSAITGGRGLMPAGPIETACLCGDAKDADTSAAHQPLSSKPRWVMS